MAGAFARILLASEHTEFDSGAEAVALALAECSEPGCQRLVQDRQLLPQLQLHCYGGCGHR